jgi:DNA-binding LytR/AlgR family response regulator
VEARTNFDKVVIAAGPSEDRFRVLDGDRVALSWRAETELIAWSDIVLAHSVGNHTLFVTCQRELKVRSPLRAVVEKLAPLGLVQVRRDVAVNASRVRRIVGAGRHRLVIILDDDRCVDVGRQFQPAVRRRFGRGRLERTRRE